MGNLTILNLIVIYLPAVCANIYNMFYANSSQQVYYLDIDSLILVIYVCLLFGIVVRSKEKFAMLHISGGQSRESAASVDDDSDNQIKTVGDLIKRMRKQSLFKKKF
jgi:hypothetical protein